MADAKPDRRRQQGEASRERLLAAAIAVIGERGYSGCGVDEICRRAGVVKSALYWHFGSKGELIAAAIARVGDAWVEEIRRSVYTVGDPLVRLDRFTAGLERIAEEQGQLLRVIIGGAAEPSADPAAGAALSDLYRRAHDVIVQGFEDSLGGSIKGFPEIARLSLGTLVAAAVQHMVDPEQTDHAATFRHLRRLVLLDLGERLEAAGLPPLRPPRGLPD